MLNIDENVRNTSTELTGLIHHDDDSAAKENDFNEDDENTIDASNDSKILLDLDWRYKWLILFCGGMSYFAIFHCLGSVSAIEDNFLSTYNLSNTEYSLLSTIVFVASIPGSLFTIKLIYKYDVYVTLILIQLIATIGQLLFFIACIIADYSDNNDNNVFLTYLTMMYIGKFISGIAQGLSDVLILLIIKLWFQGTKLSETANFLAGSVMLEFGTLSARYTTDIIYDINDLLWQSMLLGLLLCIVSLLLAFVAKQTEFVVNKQIGSKNTFKYNNNNNISDQSNNNNNNNNNNNKGGSEETLANLFENVKQFPINTWLIMTTIAISSGTYFVCYTELTEVLMIIFSLSEYNSDIIMSGSPIISFLFVPAFNYISFHYPKYNKNIFVCGIVFVFSSIFFIVLFYFVDNMSDLGISNPIPWIILIIQNVGLQVVWSFGWPLLYIECPENIQASMTSITIILFGAIALIEIELFGIISDATNAYISSLIMVLVICMFGVITAMTYKYRTTIIL